MRKRRLFSKIISALIIGSFVFAFLPKDALAVNPIVQDVYTADPAPFAAPDGKLYVYTSHDEDDTKNGFFTMYDWKCYSTEDMVNWTDHGTPLGYEDFSSWAKENSSWAGQVTYRDGYYYYYVPINHKNGTNAIGVGVSESPTGPFEDALGKPLLGPTYGYIDPTVFIDDDDQAYLYWGNPDFHCVMLNDDMISYDTSFGGVSDNGSVTNRGIMKWELETGDYSDLNSQTVKNLQKMFGTGTRMDNGKLRRPTQYEEGPWVYKREGHYYLVFAANGIPERLDYSMADSPFGPWEYKGMIMDDNVNGQGTGSFTNHPGVVDYKGHSYLFYHTGKLPNGGGYHRSVAIEEITYNDDGTINPVPFTSEGVDSVEDLDPYKRVEAETIAWEEGIEKEDCSEGGRNVCDISNNDYIRVIDVGFGEYGAIRFDASVSAQGSESDYKGEIELHLDSKNGELIGTVEVYGTGGFNNWETVSTDIDFVTGTHDLYFVFKSDAANSYKFDYWEFTQDEIPATPTPEPTAVPQDNTPQTPTGPSATAPAASVTTPAPTASDTVKADVAKVTGLKVKKSGYKAVVSWKKAANASKYEVLCSLKKNFKKNVKKLTVKTTKATIKKLKKGKTYYFKVRGISGSIKGSYSAVKKVKF